MSESTETKKVTEKKENKLLSLFTNGIIKENQVLIMMLGLCPALAVTNTFENGLGMGIIVTLVLLMTNCTISLLRKLIPNQVRIPVYILIIATEVTVVHMLTKAFAFELSESLGMFIPLITVNCIIFGRAEAFASKNTVGHSALDALGVGVGVILALSIAGFARELIGTGTLSIGKTLPLPFQGTANLFPNYAISMFTNAPGAFIVIGVMLAVTSLIQNSRRKKA